MHQVRLGDWHCLGSLTFKGLITWLSNIVTALIDLRTKTCSADSKVLSVNTPRYILVKATMYLIKIDSWAAISPTIHAQVVELPIADASHNFRYLESMCLLLLYTRCLRSVANDELDSLVDRINDIEKLDGPRSFRFRLCEARIHEKMNHYAKKSALQSVGYLYVKGTEMLLVTGTRD